MRHGGVHNNAFVRSGRRLACLGLLAAVASCAERDLGLQIRLRDTETCEVGGERVALADLSGHLARMQANDATLDLSRVTVTLPWGLTEDEARTLKARVSARIERVGLGQSVSFEEGPNPYVAFLLGAVPWVAGLGLVAAAVAVAKRRRPAAPSGEGGR